MMTIKLLSTSDAEWTASEIMAPEWAIMPAKSLKRVRMALPHTLRRDTRTAVAVNSLSSLGVATVLDIRITS